MAAAEVEAQVVSLPLLLCCGDVRRNRFAGGDPAATAEHVGAAVECLVQAFALQGVPYGSQSAGRQALVEALHFQLQVG